MFASVDGSSRLLLLVLVVGSAFVGRHPAPLDLPLLTVIPDHILDAAIHGGGNVEPQTAPKLEPPAPAPTPALTPAPQPRPELKPAPPPQPKPPVILKEPEVRASEPKSTPAPPKPSIQVQTETRRATSKPRPNTEPSVQPAVANELAERFSRSANRLSQQLTPRTTVNVPGAGGGAYASYSQVVISIYQQAWIKPVGIERPATVKASVTIARDGRVLSARITRPSGNRAVDDSVEQVLQRVKEIRPFPEGAKDDTRTFDLSFELTPAELSG